MTTASVQEHRDQVWDKISHLETETAGIKSDVRGLYAGIDEIRDVLTRMQEGNKPNLNAMFIGLLMVCTFLVTVGGLAMAPIYRDIGRLEAEFHEIRSQQTTMKGNRFTAADGAEMERYIDNLSKEIYYLKGKLNIEDKVD